MHVYLGRGGKTTGTRREGIGKITCTCTWKFVFFFILLQTFTYRAEKTLLIVLRFRRLFFDELLAYFTDTVDFDKSLLRADYVEVVF